MLDVVDDVQGLPQGRQQFHQLPAAAARLAQGQGGELDDYARRSPQLPQQRQQTGHDRVFRALYIDLEQVHAGHPLAQVVAAVEQLDGVVAAGGGAREDLVIAGVVGAQVQVALPCCKRQAGFYRGNNMPAVVECQVIPQQGEIVASGLEGEYRPRVPDQAGGYHREITDIGPDIHEHRAGLQEACQQGGFVGFPHPFLADAAGNNVIPLPVHPQAQARYAGDPQGHHRRHGNRPRG